MNGMQIAQHFVWRPYYIIPIVSPSTELSSGNELLCVWRDGCMEAWRHGGICLFLEVMLWIRRISHKDCMVYGMANWKYVWFSNRSIQTNSEAQPQQHTLAFTKHVNFVTAIRVRCIRHIHRIYIHSRLISHAIGGHVRKTFQLAKCCISHNSRRFDSTRASCVDNYENWKPYELSRIIWLLHPKCCAHDSWTFCLAHRQQSTIWEHKKNSCLRCS